VGHKIKIKQLAQEYGFEPESLKSPLWNLKSWKDNFYFRFPLCFMHTFAHGVIKRAISKLSQKFSKEWRQELNDRVINFPTFPGMLKLPNGIVFKEHRKDDFKVKIVPVSAEQIDSFVQMSVIVLNGLLTTDQLKMWKQLVQLDNKFATQTEYTKEELQTQLQKKYIASKNYILS